jgi:hypothetical protein
MRKLLLSALVVLLATAGRSSADEAAQGILEKAVKALGGEAVLARQSAALIKLHGNFQFAPNQTMPFTGEVMTQPNGDFKYTLDLTIGGMQMNFTMVLTGDKGWRNLGTPGMIEDLDPASLAEMKRSRYYDRVTSLLPLLKEKAFTLSSLSEIKVEDKPAVGVKVSSKGEPDISLYFDKESGLLIKTSYRYKQAPTEKEMLQESIYSDYREPNFTAEDERLLKRAKLQTDGASLIDYLRKRTPSGTDTAKIKMLIDQLGDDNFEVREKSTTALIGVGPPAVPQLRQAAESEDTEIKRRANQCLQAIGEQKDEKAMAAAIRLLAWRKPAGATELLLTWATRLEDDEIGREVQSALAALALADGKSDEVLVAALTDKDARRRSAAAAALGKDDGAGEKKPGRRFYLKGIKYPMKRVMFQDGAKTMDGEIVDVQFFNRFEDKPFARPK